MVLLLSIVLKMTDFKYISAFSFPSSWIWICKLGQSHAAASFGLTFTNFGHLRTVVCGHVDALFLCFEDLYELFVGQLIFGKIPSLCKKEDLGINYSVTVQLNSCYSQLIYLLVLAADIWIYMFLALNCSLCNPLQLLGSILQLLLDCFL